MDQAKATPNNLPIPLTSFIGREWEIAEVRGMLDGTRLLTLTGAGAMRARTASPCASARLRVWLPRD
jgi:hypothetical protein